MPFKEQNLPDFLLSRERAKTARYIDVLKKNLDNPAFWEQYGYDSVGNLFYKNSGLRVIDLYQKYGAPYGLPILIKNTTMAEKRARKWRQTVYSAAEKVRYPLDSFLFAQATKANQKATSEAPSMHKEVTSALDLENIGWLIKNNLVNKYDLVILCNGFKTGRDGIRENSYADRIVRFHNSGICIIPILDHGELKHFEKAHLKTPMPVGLRLKFGKVKNEYDLAQLDSRHGMSLPEIRAEAKRIKSLPNKFNLTTFLAMVSAAESITPSNFKDYHLFAARLFFELQKDHPSLKILDLGGGIPPLNRHYDHAAFLEPYLAGVKALAKEFNSEPPIIAFETGTLIATDTEALVYGVDHFKVNSLDRQGKPETWAIVKGNVMSGLPDLYVLSSEFDLVAASNANSPTIWGRIGDETCDSFGRMPSIEHPRELVPFPIVSKDLCFLVEGVGAYQDVLGGMGENVIQHCGLSSPREVTIWPDGTVTAGKLPSISKMSRSIGYNREQLPHLRKTLRPR